MLSGHSVQNLAWQFLIAHACIPWRPAFNPIVVVRCCMYLASRTLAANTVNQQLAAVRRPAHEAADAGLLSPELALSEDAARLGF
jgi:hypothetical protein